MASNTDGGSKLLSLPMELLTQITDFLGDDALATLHLTCKTLDTAVFDRFAKHHVEYLTCCALFEPRWTRICNILTRAPRLGAKVSCLSLTFALLEGRTSTEISTALTEAEDLRDDDLSDVQVGIEMEFQHNAREDAGGMRPSMSLMNGVLQEINSKGAGLVVSFAGLSQDDSAQWPVHRDLLLAVVMTKSMILDMRLALASCAGLQDFLPLYGDDLLKATSNLRNLCFSSSASAPGNGRYAYDLDVWSEESVPGLTLATSIFGSAKKLKTLELDATYIELRLKSAIATSLLLANDFESLEKLTIISVHIRLQNLLKVLAKCEKILVSLNLGTLSVAGPSTSWAVIFRQLSTIQHLHSLELSFLDVRYDVKLQKEVVFSEGQTKFSVKVDKEAVQAGLQGLMNGGFELQTWF